MKSKLAFCLVSLLILVGTASYGSSTDFELVTTDVEAVLSDKVDLQRGALAITDTKNISNQKFYYLHPGRGGNSLQPALAVGSDKVLHAVWRKAKEAGGSEIVYSYSTDLGKTWHDEELASKTSNVAGEPAIAVDSNGDVHAAWLDMHEGETVPDIFYARRTNGSWTAPVRRNNCTNKCNSLQITCGSKGSVYIAWCENDGQSSNVWCIATDRRGRSRKINIAEGAGTATDARVAAEGTGRVAVVWTQSSVPGESRLCARLSRDSFDEISDEMTLAKGDDSAWHYILTLSINKMFLFWNKGEDKISPVKTATRGFNDIATGPSTTGEMVTHPHHGY
jgi:hypothetical protein